MKINEPIEIRINSRSHQRQLVLAASVGETGMIRYSLSVGGDGTPQSLSNLQAKGVWPQKAFAGWQAEVLAVVRTGLGTVAEVR